MKKEIVLYLLFVNAFASILVAQSDSLYDALPLKFGREWVYSYLTESFNSTFHSSTSDNGIARYIVVGNSIFQDSIVWHINERKKFERNRYGYPTQYLETSSYFDIVELTSGRHKLITPIYNQNSLFPFYRPAPDTSSFYRYQINDNSMYLGLVFYPDPSNPGPPFGYNVQYYFTLNVGINYSQAHRFVGFPSAWFDKEYSFVELIDHSLEPNLIIYSSEISFVTLCDFQLNLKIPLYNNGMMPLTINAINLFDSRMNIVSAPSNIPPYSSDTLIVSFYSAIPDVVNSEIIIESNSINNPDTLKIIGKVNPPPINFTYNKNKIEFGEVEVGKQEIKNIILENLEDYPVNIIRINPSNPFFCSRLDTFLINGKQNFVDSIMFKPGVDGDFEDVLIYLVQYNGIVARTDTVFLEGRTAIVEEFYLSQNYPNPFNPSTKISWQSPLSGWQTLKVYDILGNEVATLVNEYRTAGSYEIEFNPASSIKNPASGIYFYRLQAGDYVETKKMILLK
jgi:hypothetical protein